jgi:NAD(P)-dependent dehydrogenase (short-subunit alcohol dehydrogenase family)
MSSSTLGSVVSGSVHYMASKAGIVGITRALTSELGPYSIVPRPAMASMEDEYAHAASMQAIKRPKLPADLVGTVSFLTSDDAAFITGQTLNVDGGRIRS